MVGAADRARVAELIDRIGDGPPVIAVSPISTAKSFLDVPITEMTEHSRAFVKVQEGCNESCTFCIVPRTRGASRSRTPASVLDQVRRLVDTGYVEVVLTGVHLGDYGLDLPGRRRMLPDLIERILEIDGIERFRLSSIEPASLGDEIITLMAESPKFARHFHIPFQSGSDAVLARMKRRYRAGEFADLVTRIGERVPGCGIGTDVICGFPGETDEDFLRTLRARREAPHHLRSRVHIFAAPRLRGGAFHRRGAGRDQEAPHPRVEAALGREAPPLRRKARRADRRGAHRAGAARQRCSYRRVD